MVVLAQPLIDNGLSLPGGGEPFGIQDFPAQGASLIPAERQAVATSAPATSSTSTCRKIFRHSSSEYRFRAILNPPAGTTIVAQF
jgi:hypothetical protein